MDPYKMPPNPPPPMLFLQATLKRKKTQSYLHCDMSDCLSRAIGYRLFEKVELQPFLILYSISRPWYRSSI